MINTPSALLSLNMVGKDDNRVEERFKVAVKKLIKRPC